MSKTILFCQLIKPKNKLAMAANKLKHLEFIQLVITRMNSNSFLIKGWTITLVSALFALAAKDANLNFVRISYLVIPVFWILDGFYVSQERQYRGLYDNVAARTEESINFDMDASIYNVGRSTWLRGIFSTTLLLFYPITVAATLVVSYIFKGNLHGV